MKHLIRKGFHRSWKMFSHPIFNFKQTKTFNFTESCWWWWNDPDRDGDWSKILGWFNGWDVHYESYRFGFRPNKKKGYFNVCPYIYQNGIRLPEPIVLTKRITSKTKLSVELIKETVYFKVDDLIIYQIDRIKKSWYGISADIYIGGGTKTDKDWSAPQDITLFC